MILSRSLSDAQVESGPVPAALDGERASGVLWQAAPGRFLLDVPGVARYLVKDGATIAVDPVPRSDEQAIARYLHMTPLAALCFQRGVLAFHAASCAPPKAPSHSPGPGGAGGAILIAGDSGVGKSTLLAALLQRGWTMFADELTVVQVNAQGQPFALPTTPEIRLWDDAVAGLNFGDESRMGTARAAAKELRQDEEFVELDADGESGRIFQCPERQFAGAPIHLHAIYWLSVYPGTEVETNELSAGERFGALSKLTYNSHIADALLDRVLYLRNGSAIVQIAPVRRLRRPRGRWSAAELADVILEHADLHRLRSDS